MNRDSQGVWVPIEIWEIEELGWTEKLLLALVLHLDNDEGCFASNEYLAKRLLVSKDRITRMVSGLKQKGYITVDLIYKEGTKAVEKRVIKVVERYRYKYREGIGENTEDNKKINKKLNKKVNSNIYNQQIELFNQWWDLYDKKIDRKKCEMRFLKILESHSFEEIMEGTKRYLDHLKATKTEKQYQKYPYTFLNGENWKDEFKIPPKQIKGGEWYGGNQQGPKQPRSIYEKLIPNSSR